MGRPVAGELDGGAVPLWGAEAGVWTLVGLRSSGSSVASKDEAAPGPAVAGAVSAAAEAEAVALAGTCAWPESP